MSEFTNGLSESNSEKKKMSAVPTLPEINLGDSKELNEEDIKLVNENLKSERKEMSAVPSLPDINECESKESNEEDIKLEKINSFKKIVNEFLTDLLKTFPELIEGLDLNLLKIWKAERYSEEERNTSVKTVIEYCEKIYPERFFDLLYQNNDIFTNEEINLYFLPGIDFRILWKEDITDKTKEVMWKYLQLILFTIISGVSNGESFGDTANLFKAINQDEFKNKLEETMENMKNIFENNSSDEEINLDDMPSAESVHEHVTGMMDGKLGALAKEIAEETANEMDFDLGDGEDINQVNDVFSKLLKDPNKLMSMIKNVGNKLDEKLKKGDIKESELLEEATNLMAKMKEMPGMGNMQEMLSKMGLGSKGKINENAMKAQLQRNLRLAKQKEGMKNKINKNSELKMPDLNSLDFKNAELNAENTRQELLKELDVEESVFRQGPKAERSKLSNKKKKKGKKKK